MRSVLWSAEDQLGPDILQLIPVWAAEDPAIATFQKQVRAQEEAPRGHRPQGNLEYAAVRPLVAQESGPRLPLFVAARRRAAWRTTC
ncbi:hypothetical protein [Deinococcus hopiensis]|uniref:hypothetical protein n=1 Tax=Deinococcus hopiensis TaxID=309885 RepID=UPI00111C19A5|nr:hypothetical protein [Deinococcus hopiensis]